MTNRCRNVLGRVYFPEQFPHVCKHCCCYGSAVVVISDVDVVAVVGIRVGVVFPIHVFHVQ